MKTVAIAVALALLGCAHNAAQAAGAPAAGASQRAAGARIQAGQAIYARCLACHALAYDRTGPRHCGLFGRKAGSVPGFGYSEAMKQSNIVWDEQTLARFLAHPTRTVPGTSMGYAGVPEPRERADLIAYLKSASEGPECQAH